MTPSPRNFVTLNVMQNKTLQSSEMLSTALIKTVIQLLQSKQIQRHFRKLTKRSTLNNVEDERFGSR